MVCPNCKEEIGDNLKVCTYCNYKLRYSMMFRILAVIGIIAVIAVNVWIIYQININI